MFEISQNHKDIRIKTQLQNKFEPIVKKNYNYLLERAFRLDSYSYSNVFVKNLQNKGLFKDCTFSRIRSGVKKSNSSKEKKLLKVS